jgi:transposase-like protein
MANVARRARRRKPAEVGSARRRQQQRVVRAEVRRAVGAAVRAVVERALAGEVTALLGRERYARRAAVRGGEVAARCSRCGTGAARRFVRAGSYTRGLVTTAATVRVRVPRVGCLCGGTVPLAFATIAPYQRAWGDVQERARELAGLCLSLRDAGEVLARESGQVLARGTLSRWGRQAGALAEALRAGPLARVPPVVMLDGIWVKLMRETGEGDCDRAGRRRRRVRRVRVPVLVAYGVDPATGERWVLDWELGEGEDEASWRRLLERLLARGLRADAGLALFLHDGGGGLEAALGLVDFGPEVLRQRCVFHVLRNVGDAVQGEAGMAREAKRARRREVVRAAAAIDTTEDRAEAHRRRRAFAAAWGERELRAVAALERAFAATTAYLAALERARELGEAWQARYLRATSLLERANRGLRQKARQVGVFQAEAGLAAALGLAAAHRRLAPGVAAAPDWAEEVEAALLTA